MKKDKIALSQLRFCELCRMARAMLEIPVVSICLQDNEFYWIDLADHLSRHEWDFATSLKTCALPDERQWMVVDALKDERCSRLPYVAGAPEVRFIASVSFGPKGIGRLNLFDTRPRDGFLDKLPQLEDIVKLADQCIGFLTMANDATEQESLFRLLAETSTDTLVRGNLDGVRLYVSPSIQDLLGYRPEELLGRQALDITHPDDAPAFGSLMKEMLAGGQEVTRIELRQKHKNGQWIWMEAAIRLTHDFSSGQPNGYVASVREIGQRKKLQARLEQLASYDQLTGLPNRVSFNRMASNLLSDLSKDSREFALFFMDLDGFKQVNDQFGHPAGDALLREVAARFRSTLRSNDIVARLGGDEFVAALRTNDTEASSLAGRLVQAISKPFIFENHEIIVGLSIGIARIMHGERDLEALLARADKALYVAKQRGKNTFVFSDAHDS